MIEYLDPITAKEALNSLYEDNPSLRELICSTVERILGEIDWSGISEELFSALELIDMSDVWHNAGSNEFGYTDPVDAASELIEEEIRPFRDEMVRYLKHGRPDLARHYCHGILDGIYRFAQESQSQFNECACDSLFYHFDELLSEWLKSTTDDKALAETAQFLQEHCLRWAK